MTEADKKEALEDVENCSTVPFFGIGKIWVDINRIRFSSFETIRKALQPSKPIADDKKEALDCTLKDKLKHHRLKNKLTLDALAKLSGCSKSYLWELENRYTLRPSAEKLREIALALSVTTEYLLDKDAKDNEEVKMEAFYRKFNRLSEEDQKRIQDMIDNWGKKE